MLQTDDGFCVFVWLAYMACLQKEKSALNLERIISEPL
jgi:hypothetical protein